MNSNYYIEITSESINVNKSLNFVLCNNEDGAIVTFIGKVRKKNFDRDVFSINYDVFDELAINIILCICKHINKIYNKGLKIFISHFKGLLYVGDVSVLILVSSSSRVSSFVACKYIIDQIKIRVPIWKQENYVNGESKWVKGHIL